MAAIKGFFFDQDGVIIDTEKDGHRVAFNKTFQAFGFDFQWSIEQYHELLQIGGGKERMHHYLNTQGFGKEVRLDDEDELIKEMHQYKTNVFIQLIEQRQLPLRPGVMRLMKEINERNLVLGICTTSEQRAANAIASRMLENIRIDFILAGDVVSNKKPAPEIYHLAQQRSSLDSEECVVIEDSRNGVSAAKAAGLHVVATINFYTRNEDLSQADIIVSCLGDSEGEKGELLTEGRGLKFDGVLTVEKIIEYFST